MAWGKKRDREQEFLRTGQPAALRPGDIGSKDVYEEPDNVGLFDFSLEDEEVSESDPDTDSTSRD